MLDSTDPEELGFCPQRLARIDTWMARYLAAGKLPGCTTIIARDGRVAYRASQGLRDREAGLPMADDTIVRIYSMTKPVTAVAVMMLLEEGLVRLDDPLSAYLPEFADMAVYRRGDGKAMETEPADGPITLHHLLLHTAGLTYGFMEDHPVCALYRKASLDFTPKGTDLADRATRLAALPLVHQPGTAWAYSVAFDVLGRVVEVVAGQSFDRFLETRVFEPLGMRDTGFALPTAKRDRLAALYGLDRAGALLRSADNEAVDGTTVRCFSGGGGLLSTADDYLRFAEMLRCGGRLAGERLLSPRTVAFMTSNHLPGGCDLAAMGQSRFSETSYVGIGFGLGMSVVLAPGPSGVPASPGVFAWGGAASTAFFVDPRERLVVLFLTQLIPSDSYPLRQELRALTYQALID